MRDWHKNSLSIGKKEEANWMKPRLLKSYTILLSKRSADRTWTIKFTKSTAGHRGARYSEPTDNGTEWFESSWYGSWIDVSKPSGPAVGVWKPASSVCGGWGENMLSSPKADSELSLSCSLGSFWLGSDWFTLYCSIWDWSGAIWWYELPLL